MKYILLLIIGFSAIAQVSAQMFPDPATLGTGYNVTPCTSGSTTDPTWLVYSGTTTEPIITPANYLAGFTFNPAKVNCNTCGSWVANQAPYKWISPDGNCTNFSAKNYYIYRLPINLPSNCGQNISYSITFDGYVDDLITNIYVNGVATGINTSVSQQWLNAQSITINSGWIAGMNYIDIVVYNSGGGATGLRFAVTTVQDENHDGDGDGIADIFDDCPCEAGNNSIGCIDDDFTCDVDLIRTTFQNAGCQELIGCWDDCSMYFLNPQYLPGNSAQAFAENYGANLISIQSAEENACILSDLNRLGYGSGDVIWIGFNDEAIEGQFVWYDQSPVVYTNWAPGEPNNSGNNEDCVQIYPGGSNPGTWNDLNCGGYNSMSIIEVNLCPVTNVTAPITLCQDQDTTIAVVSTILGSSPYTYEWDNNSTQVSQTIAPATSTDYHVTVKDRYNCSVDDVVHVTVKNNPTADFTFDEICQLTDEVHLQNTSSDPENGSLSSHWTYNTNQTSNEQNPAVTLTNPNNNSIELIVANAFNCKDTIVKNISPTISPIADFTVQANCIDKNLQITNTSSIGNNTPLQSFWDFGNGQTSSATTPTISYSNSGNQTIQLTVTSQSGCKDSISKDVTIYPNPSAPNLVSNSPVECYGDEFIFGTNAINGASYHWSGPNGFTSNSAENSLISSAENIGNYQLFITVNGCPSDVASILLEATGGVDPIKSDFPNIITPNGDGINDEMDLNDYFSTCTEFQLTLFNRWGLVVWEQNTNDPPFQGKDKSGKDLTEGVYFYKLTYNQETVSGFISIVR